MSYMINGLLIKGEKFAHFPLILGSPSSYMTLNPIRSLNFLTYEDIFFFFFISVTAIHLVIDL
jgi:hypothetical protein